MHVVVSVSVEFKPAVLIPVFNHEHAIGDTLKSVMGFGYPILLVDDGSDAACHQVLENLQQDFNDQVQLLTLSPNQGKGAAVKAGMVMLEAQGVSHAIQVDADGQHDISQLPAMLGLAKAHPDAIVSGYPEYDESVPKARYFGRYLTHVWVWISTLSLAIRDSMCGFRVYPVELFNRLIEKEGAGDRMEFDTEVIVRWSWRGGEVINHPTAVRYPSDGVSHFRVLRDNVRISLMHTRLFFGMLRRFPRLLEQKIWPR